MALFHVDRVTGKVLARPTARLDSGAIIKRVEELEKENALLRGKAQTLQKALRGKARVSKKRA
jgi:hypothetical protein